LSEKQGAPLRDSEVVWGSLVKVKHFFPLAQCNPILKRQFDDVSDAQMERMIEMSRNLLSTPHVKNGT